MKSGDACPECGGRIKVLDSKVRRGKRVRYFGCAACKFRPPRNKQIVPLRYAPKRT